MQTIIFIIAWALCSIGIFILTNRLSNQNKFNFNDIANTAFDICFSFILGASVAAFLVYVYMIVLPLIGVVALSVLIAYLLKKYSNKNG